MDGCVKGRLSTAIDHSEENFEGRIGEG